METKKDVFPNRVLEILQRKKYFVHEEETQNFALYEEVQMFKKGILLLKEKKLSKIVAKNTKETNCEKCIYMICLLEIYVYNFALIQSNR